MVEVDHPEPAPVEVQVRVVVSAVNPTDCKARLVSGATHTSVRVAALAGSGLHV